MTMTRLGKIYNDLFDIYEGLQSFRETDPPLVQRLAVARDTRRELRRLTATNVESKDAIDILTMLENGLGHWLTFVEYPEVEQQIIESKRYYVNR